MNQQSHKIADQSQEKNIIQCLNELRQEMEERGLTQEILDDILKEES